MNRYDYRLGGVENISERREIGIFTSQEPVVNDQTDPGTHQTIIFAGSIPFRYSYHHEYRRNTLDNSEMIFSFPPNLI